MTMIVSATTKDFVLMVSDRRLTSLEDRSVVTDRENKMVILNEEMILGYTGFADLDGVSTEQWVLETLHGHDPREWISRLREKATQAITRIRRPLGQKRHAFLIAGWQFRDAGSPFPNDAATIIVSNFHDDNGMQLRTAERRFRVIWRPLANYRAVVSSAGHPIIKTDRLQLERTIARYFHANPRRPQGALAILADEVLKAARHNPTVGSSLTIASFPRTAIHSGVTGYFDLSTADWANTLATAYIGQDMMVRGYGPAFINPMMVMMGIQATNDPIGFPLEDLRRPL